MDPTHFDNLTRSLFVRAPRRRALSRVLLPLGVLLGLGAERASGENKKKNKKNKNKTRTRTRKRTTSRHRQSRHRQSRHRQSHGHGRARSADIPCGTRCCPPNPRFATLALGNPVFRV